MQPQNTAKNIRHYENIPILDREFDLFEINYDLKVQLRTVMSEQFYNDSLSVED
jgi:hypothetical protein